MLGRTVPCRIGRNLHISKARTKMNMKLFARYWMIAIFFLSATSIASAQTCQPLCPGALDPAFGTGGKAIYQIHNSLGVAPDGMTVQADGKIVAVVGYDVEQLVRLNTDGSLDQSFGVGGIVRFTWSLAGSYGDVQAVAMQNVVDPVTLVSEQRIVIAGLGHIQSGRNIIGGLRVSRYRPDGSVDTSFGSPGGNGSTFVNTGYASAIAIQSDGKIVTVGVDNGKLVRLTANGILDTSFGTGGVVSTYASRALAIDSAGGILVGGSTSIGKGNKARSIMAAKRYTTDGNVDASFGTAGVATADFGVSSQMWRLIIDAVGNIVAGGTVGNGAGIARLTSNGINDPSFGTSGKVMYTTFSGPFFGRGLAIQPVDGKILLTGQWNNNFSLARFNNDGSLDTTFGTGGSVSVDVSGADYSNVSVIQMDPDCSCQKIVMSGGAVPNTSFARFIAQ
jgi:uncharacterized delta-60 repeat protein